MKCKKLASLVMAGALTLSLAAPAFAATDTEITDIGAIGTASNTEITGTTNVPTIKVTTPNAGAVVVNPYKLTYVVDVGDDADDPSDDTTSTNQIISAVQYIKSESDVPLKVNVTATGKTEGEAVFATTTTVGNTKLTNKSAFVYFQIKGATAAKDSGADTVSITDPDWGTFSATDAGTIVLGAKAVTKNNTVTLAAATEVADEAGTGTVTIPSVAAFRLNGDAVTSPTKAWTGADKVSATLAFTFTADAVAPAAGG